MHDRVVCCSECDELSKLPRPLKPGRYRCPECGHTLVRFVPGMVEKLYALNLAAATLYLMSLLYPFLSFEVLGNRSTAWFLTPIENLYDRHEYILAVTVLMTILVVPAARILLYLAVAIPVYHGRVPRYLPYALKLLEEFLPWGMLDVFLIGVLVSIVKLLGMGSILPQAGFWLFAAMIPILAYIQMIFDPHPLWELIETAQRGGKIPYPLEPIL
ncbi:paraquat-inducible protein A [Nitratifractor sp.]